MSRMNLQIDETDKKTIVQALTVLAEEYQKCADTVLSSVLQRGFQEDADRITALRHRIAGLIDSENLRAETKKVFLQSGKIYAIKFHREQTGFGLKESKEYVDTIHDETEPGWRDRFGR